VNEVLEVHYFEVTEGLPEEICDDFNAYTKRLRETFEARMTTLSALNEEMTTKLAMYQNEKMLSDLTPVELINMAFVKGDEVFKMWKEFKRNCSKSTLRTLCETEFEETISEITSDTIQKSIDKF
jgi:hypothetical protein